MYYIIKSRKSLKLASYVGNGVRNGSTYFMISIYVSKYCTREIEKFLDFYDSTITKKLLKLES